MSRFKYVVAEHGIDWVREKVLEYSGVKPQPWQPLPPWEFKNYMGWQEQGDGKLFLGINVENGRIKDEESNQGGGGVRMKAALREIVERYNTPVLFTPTQSLYLSDIEPEHKVHIERILKVNGIKYLESDLSDLTLAHMACPALPMCGLATTEAERVSGDVVHIIDRARKAAGVPDLTVVSRITGCPNGCARTYMAEVGLVGSGPNMYQVWLGGSHNQTRTAQEYEFKVKYDDIEALLTNLFTVYREARTAKTESFGDFCHRIGPVSLKEYIDSVEGNVDDKVASLTEDFKTVPRPDDTFTFDFIDGVADKIFKEVDVIFEDVVSDEDS